MSEDYCPEVKVLCCSRSVNKDVYLAEGRKNGEEFVADFTVLPCSSAIEVGYLIKLIEQGADGVLLVACEEKQCQLLRGSTRARKRIEHAGNLLNEVGVSPSRVRIKHGHGLSAGDIMDFAGQMARDVRPLGRNPMKISDRKVTI